MKHDASVPKLYEYVANDGTVYWSFTKQPFTISHPMRLVLQNRSGIVLPRMMALLQAEAKIIAYGELPVEEEDGSVDGKGGL